MSDEKPENSQPEEKVISREDLSMLGLAVERTWREIRPNAVAALEARGALYESILIAEQNATEMEDLLVKQGMDRMRAEHEAHKEYIHIPDFEAEQ